MGQHILFIAKGVDFAPDSKFGSNPQQKFHPKMILRLIQNLRPIRSKKQSCPAAGGQVSTDQIKQIRPHNMLHKYNYKSTKIHKYTYKLIHWKIHKHTKMPVAKWVQIKISKSGHTICCTNMNIKVQNCTTTQIYILTKLLQNAQKKNKNMPLGRLRKSGHTQYAALYSIHLWIKDKYTNTMYTNMLNYLDLPILCWTQYVQKKPQSTAVCTCISP